MSSYQIELRSDTAANWTSVNPVLGQGEVGVELGDTPEKFKIGDGVSTWSELDYAGGVAGACGVSGVSGVPGACGVSGVAGACGVSGVPGACGVSGAGGGACGVSGVAGACGVSGVAGACGHAGACGVSGVAGACGVSGVAGACGVSGVSGAGGSGPFAAQFNPYSYSATGGSNDTTAVQDAINAAVASGVASQVYLPSIFNITGVSVTDATAPITLTGPGGLKLNADASASSAIINVVDSPYTTIKGLTLDQNGANQTNANLCVIAYDNASSNLKVYDNTILNAIGFAFFKADGTVGTFTNNVDFCRNVVNCYTAGVYQDMVVMTMVNGGHCDGNTVIGMTGEFSAINIYESDQCPSVGNTVTVVAPASGGATFGIAVQSSSGCPVTGNTVWGNGTGAEGFYAYAVFKEGDNDDARTQTDASFSNNNSYQTAGSNGATLYIGSASNTVFDGGVHVGFGTPAIFLVATGTCGAIQISNLIAPGLTYSEFWANEGTVSPAPVFHNITGVNPATVTTPSFPATTTTWTNTTGVDVFAYITNGVDAMTTVVNGNTGPAIAASAKQTIFIPANGTFTPTFSGGTPSWVLQGN